MGTLVTVPISLENSNLMKMAIGTYISIITLNVNGLMRQPKDTDWLNRYKNKTYIYAVYKKPTSDLKTHRSGRAHV